MVPKAVNSIRSQVELAWAWAEYMINAWSENLFIFYSKVGLYPIFRNLAVRNGSDWPWHRQIMVTRDTDSTRDADAVSRARGRRPSVVEAGRKHRWTCLWRTFFFFFLTSRYTLTIDDHWPLVHVLSQKNRCFHQLPRGHLQWLIVRFLSAKPLHPGVLNLRFKGTEWKLRSKRYGSSETIGVWDKT